MEKRIPNLEEFLEKARRQREEMGAAAASSGGTKLPKAFNLPGFLSGNADGVVIRSSTPGSEKRFKITVDDSGAISAAEVTE